MRTSPPALAIAVALALVTTACGGRGEENSAGGGGGASDPGVTDTEITFGGTFPYSGPASSYAVVGQAATAYFDYVNDEFGGVKMGDGKTRKINYITEDDAYEPNRTVEAARKLIEQDKVFGLHNMLGTGTNLAAWDYINQQEVPHVFIGGGASNWGADVETHPWSTGWQIAYTTEASIWAQYLEETNPDAKVAVLFQNDDLGKDYLGGFKAAIEGSDIEVVAEQSFATTDATVEGQMTNLAASGADTFLNVSTPKFAAQAIRKKADLGWDAKQIIAAVASSVSTVYTPAGLDNAKGIISADFLKDPSSPLEADDEGVMQYKAKLGEYGAQLDPNDRNVIFGWSAAETLYKALEKTEEPTRDSFMDSVRNLDIDDMGMFIEGIPVKTGPDDGYPVEAAQLKEFDGASLVPLGDVISNEGKTPVIEK